MTASQKTKDAASALLGLNTKAPRTAASTAVSTSSPIKKAVLSPEQEYALSSSSNRVVITALAGAGKSKVLGEYAKRNPTRKWSYIAFNKAMAASASQEMPGVDCRTLHSLAYSRYGMAHEERIGLPWDLDDLLDWVGQDASNELAALWISVVYRFMASADQELNATHIPLSAWKRWQEKSGATSADAHEVVKASTKVWEGIISASSGLPMELDATVKLMQLAKLNPFPKGASLLVDEGQDLTPCVRSWLDDLSLPVIRAGDPYQSIYGWRMQGLATPWIGKNEDEKWLCGSWRFGQEVANLAAHPLSYLGCPQNIIGLGSPTKIDTLPTENGVLLARTRAGLVSQAIKEVAAGRKISLEHAPWLMSAIKSGKVEDDLGPSEEQGWSRGNAGKLENLSKSIDPKGLVLMTAHASKGGTFDTVRLADDFSWPPKRQSEEGSVTEEARVLYVALTRARKHLSLPEKLLNSLSSTHSDGRAGNDIEDSGF